MLVVALMAEVSRRRLIFDVVQLACCTTSLVIYDNRHLLPGYSGYIVYLNDDNVARNRGLGARAKQHYSSEQPCLCLRRDVYVCVHIYERSPSSPYCL